MSNVFHGSRAIVQITDVASGKSKTVGIFTDCSWGVNYGATPIHPLGNVSPQEITYTHQDAITVNASGYRVVANGVYTAARMPQLNELLSYGSIELIILDRQTGQTMFHVTGCKPISWDSGVSSRTISTIRVTFMGLRSGDGSKATPGDDSQNGQSTGAPQLADK